MENQHIIRLTVLAIASYDLLSSSSSSRYNRRAIMHSRFMPVPDNILEESRNLYEKILKSEHRDVPEIKLALLLPVLAELHEDEFLSEVGKSDHKCAKWVAALARHLIKEREET